MTAVAKHRMKILRAMTTLCEYQNPFSLPSVCICCVLVKQSVFVLGF